MGRYSMRRMTPTITSTTCERRRSRTTTITWKRTTTPSSRWSATKCGSGSTKMGWTSPDALFKAAKDEYLNGRPPKTQDEWILVVNYWAYNIGDGLEESACVLLGRMYSVPLQDDEIRAIAKFQVKSKAKEKRAQGK